MLGKIKKSGLKILVVLFIVSLLTACGDKPELTVGVEDGFQPFGFQEQGRYQGFEIDLWKAVAAEAGMKFKLQSMSPAEMMSALEKRKIDAAIAGLSIKSARKKQVEYSTPYFSSGLLIVVRLNEENINSPKDLAQKIVATKIGTTAYDYAIGIKEVKEVRAFPDIEQAYWALIGGRADAVIFDAENAYHFAKNEGKGQVKTVGEVFTKEQYAIALQTGSPYTGRINNALRELGKNGTYERLYKKWFGHAPESIPGDDK